MHPYLLRALGHKKAKLLHAEFDKQETLRKVQEEMATEVRRLQGELAVVQKKRREVEEFMHSEFDNVTQTLDFLLDDADSLPDTSFDAFLAMCTIADDRFCPFDVLKSAFKTFERKYGYKACKNYSWDAFKPALEKFGIERVRDMRDYKGRVMTREYLVGIDVGDDLLGE